jgi:alcohol dehydrogenase
LDTGRSPVRAAAGVDRTDEGQAVRGPGLLGGDMRAAVMRAPRAPLTIEDVADPFLPRDGAVVEVRATGVCRSDWHAWQGHDSEVRLPHVGGHECAGVVVEVGPDVRRVAVGDRVTLPFCGGCGHCEWCVAGETQLCLNGFLPGFVHWGSLADLIGVQHADLNLIPLPDGLVFTAAAALGCRFMTAWAAVHVHGGVQPGDGVVVHGAGGLGLAAVMIAASAGARVVAVDPQPGKRAMARGFGATATVDPDTDDVPAAVLDLLHGGAQVSIDAVGSPEVISHSIASLGRRGVHVQVGLLYGDDARPPVSMDAVYNRELRVVGTMGMAVRHYPGLLDAVGRGWVAPERLITKTIGLGDISAELEEMTRFGQTGVTVAVL